MFTPPRTVVDDDCLVYWHPKSQCKECKTFFPQVLVSQESMRPLSEVKFLRDLWCRMQKKTNLAQNTNGAEVCQSCQLNSCKVL